MVIKYTAEDFPLGTKVLLANGVLGTVSRPVRPSDWVKEGCVYVAYDKPISGRSSGGYYHPDDDLLRYLPASYEIKRKALMEEKDKLNIEKLRLVFRIGDLKDGLRLLEADVEKIRTRISEIDEELG